MENVIDWIKNWTWPDYLALGVLFFAFVAFYGYIGTVHQAQSACTEVQGRDYEGCVEQQYDMIRAAARNSE